MKKKSIFLLVASGLGLALVGSTFAAWAVTDNASPFSIKVSTGTISTDTTTNYVTLHYGESQNIGNVGELAAETFRKAGVLDLRATTSNAAAINGQLEMTVADSTGTGLAAQLVVEVFSGNLEATNGVISSATRTAALSNKISFTGTKSAAINTTSATAHLFTVVVSLKSGITAAELEALQGKVANITFDWNIADGTEIATTKTLYATGFGGDVYVYAFKGTKANAAWPGVKMESATRNGYYTAAVNVSEFDTVVFNNGKSGEQEVKSADLVIATTFTGALDLYTYDATTPAIGTYVELVTPVYYLVGNQWGNWTTGSGAVLMTAGTGANAGKWTGSLTTTGNGEFKVYDSANDIWYGEYGSNDGNNVSLGEAGTYNITFDPAAVTCIVCAKQSA